MTSVQKKAAYNSKAKMARRRTVDGRLVIRYTDGSAFIQTPKRESFEACDFSSVESQGTKMRICLLTMISVLILLAGC
jgi:hypothetical protein